MKTIRLKPYMAVIALLIVLQAILMIQSYLAHDALCQSVDNNLHASSAWRLSPSDENAQIIWQLAEQNTRRTEWSGLPNTGIVASDRHVIFTRQADGSECDMMTRDLIAFDLLTGSEVWRLPPPPSRIGYSNFGYSSYVSVFHRMQALPDGYVLITADHLVLKLDFDGQIEWSNNDLPSRSLETVYYEQDHLYLPSYSKVYELDPDTGNLARTIDIPNVVAFFGDFAAIGDANHNDVEVIDRSTAQDRFTIGLRTRVPLENALVNLWPFTDVFSDTLFVYNDTFTPTHVAAYNISTGEELWSVDSSFKGFPIFLGNSMIGYDSDGLEIYDLQTGELLNQIRITRIENGVEDINPLRSVWLAGYDDIVVVNFRDTWELVALQVPSLISNLDQS